MTERGSHPTGPSPYRRDGSPFRLEGVVFDFDGTLTEPGVMDFDAIHQAVGCPRHLGILEFISALADPEERRVKEGILGVAEMEAAERSRANKGADELVAFLHGNGIPMAVITRNSRRAVDKAFAGLTGIDPAAFSVVVTRDLPMNPKPFPDGVRFVAKELNVDAGRLLMIGDHAFDIEAGARAGAMTMFLRNDPLETPGTVESDFVVDTLAEALEVIRFGLPLPVGKLPTELLERSLAGVIPDDPAVLVGAAVGEDAAAIDVAGAEVLVLTSDPITLAGDSMARYAVLVNANDIATSGATPRWLLSTLLFPPGSSASEVLAMTRDIQQACAGIGVALCGGHTEISNAVLRPLVVATMAGAASATELMDKRSMREGDRVLLTKGVAIEGTGLIAREFSSRLLDAGMTVAEVEQASTFLERIGILTEAGIARTFAGVTALHDVTEGGLATAVRELGAAGGRRLRLHMENIPVYLETRRICSILGLDPLGLIGSGSLLITCSPADVEALAAAVAAAAIEIADIGEVLDEGEGVEAFEEGVRTEWPSFQRDELARLER